jgi:NAD-dependent DNA ligase
MNNFIETIEKQTSSNDVKKLYQEKNADFLKKVANYASNKYYNTGEHFLSDRNYDILIEVIQKKDPSFIPDVGAPVVYGEKVKLPYWMGSANKITPEDQNVLANWLKKHESTTYVVSSKLDGVSCLFCVAKNKIKLYTRGDGTVGTDISHLKQYIKLPQNFTTNMCVRGELIIPKDVFAKKYSQQFKNARNMVSGIIARKEHTPELKDVHFVVYELLNTDMTPLQQLQELSENFEVVEHKIINILTIPILETNHEEFKKQSPYEIDGIIVQSNVAYKRNESGNPSYMFAFKMMGNDSIATTKVIDIEWNISKTCQIKPVVIIETVELSGVSISRASGHNAKYIEENKLGPGAIVEIVRSQEVIPYIHNVVKPAKAKFPNIKYKWDENHVNIIALEGNNESCIKKIAFFFSNLGIKFLGEETIKKLYVNGLDSVLKIISATPETIINLQIEGIENKSANRICNNIKEGLKNTTIPKIIASSGLFGDGIGTRKLEKLFEHIPNLLEMENDPKLRELMLKIPSFADVTIDKIIPNIKYAKIFIYIMRKFATFEEDQKQNSIKTKSNIKSSNNLLNGKSIVFTGFRDKNLENTLKKLGGLVKTSVSKNTDILIYGGNDYENSKYLKAKEIGTIEIISKDDFMKKYNI